MQKIEVCFEPSTKKEASAMLSLADIRAGETLVDLGSGDGCIVVPAALRGAYAIGVEKDSELLSAARKKVREYGVSDRVRFFRGRIERFVIGRYSPISFANVVAVNLYEEQNEILAEPLRKKLPSAGRIVSNNATFPRWVTSDVRSVVNPDTRRITYVYLYRMNSLKYRR